MGEMKLKAKIKIWITINNQTTLQQSYITIIKENQFRNSISYLQLRVLHLKETILENINNNSKLDQHKRDVKIAGSLVTWRAQVSFVSRIF